MCLPDVIGFDNCRGPRKHTCVLSFVFRPNSARPHTILETCPLARINAENHSQTTLSHLLWPTPLLHRASRAVVLSRMAKGLTGLSTVSATKTYGRTGTIPCMSTAAGVIRQTSGHNKKWLHANACLSCTSTGFSPDFSIAAHRGHAWRRIL